MQVNFHFDEDHYLGSVLVSQPLTSDKLLAAFPFQQVDQFQFRLKVNAKEILGNSRGDVDFLWLDLPFKEGTGLRFEDVLSNEQLSVDVQVRQLTSSAVDLFYEEEVVIEEEDGSMARLPPLPMPEERPARSAVPATAHSSNIGSNASTGSAFQLPKFLRKSNSSNQSHTSHTPVDKERSSSTTSTSANVSTAQVADTMKKGATSLWKAVVSTAEKLQHTLKLDETRGDGDGESSGANVLLIHEHLSNLTSLLSSSYQDENSQHVQLLRQLFVAQCQEDNTVLESTLWKNIGWQGIHPKSDLKSSGLLAISAMLYFHQHYSKQSADMIARNKANLKTTYPFAIVGVNLTLLLADLFQLRDHNYRKVSPVYQAIFMEEHAFYEIFCLSFAHVDFLWQSKSAVRSQFGQIINDIKVLLMRILQRNPQSMDEFHFVAIDEGMARLH